MEKVFIGVDPGITGAMAIIFDKAIEVYDYQDLKGLIRLQGLVKQKGLSLYAMIESVHVIPKQSAQAGGKMMDNFGEWKGVFKALSIPYELVIPLTWQKKVYDKLPVKPSIPKMPETGLDQKEYDKLVSRVKYQRKKIAKEFSLEFARRKHPQAIKFLTRKKDDNRADALNIASYCKQRNDKVEYIDYLA